MLIVLAASLLWVGLLGLLWRRSLVGMLMGVALAWFAIAVGAIAFAFGRGDAESQGLGGVLALTMAAVAVLQIAFGLALVVSRIKRRGSLDADDAGLLEG